MNDPIAFLLTWPTYGTWLPGDERGWVEYGLGWQLPDPIRRIESQCRMTEAACRLTSREREIVETQVAETCEYRGWRLYAVNCRSNHIHVVVGAPETSPKKIRVAIKAWSARRLKELSDPTRHSWWAERGSSRFIFDEASLEIVVQYVLEAQDRTGLEQVE